MRTASSPTLSSPLDAPLHDFVTDLRIVPAQTRLAFSTRSVIGTVHGVFTDVRGVVRLNEADPRYTHVDVRVPVASIVTHSTVRDARFLGPEFFDAVAYPAICFYGRWLRGDPLREFALDGELRVRDVGREITLDVRTIDRTVDGAGATEHARYRATTVIDRRDFRLVARHRLDLGPLALGYTIRITLEVTLARQRRASAPTNAHDTLRRWSR